MNLTKINKRKAAMLLHQIEESLASFVIEKKPHEEDFPEKTVMNIITRCEDKNIELDKSNIESILEATYLDEIFQFALKTTENTSLNKYVSELMNLFKQYNIFFIRNVLAHPNKKFLNEYWYKIAVVASCNLIDILGLKDIKESLIAAEQNSIVDPPVEWLEEFTHDSIPNNLPKNFEHTITGLVGRTTEEKELLKLLDNPRISTISIVASGGIGKTALVLDLLNKLLLNAKTTNWCEAIIYIDMKIEKLTINGVKKLVALETLEEVKDNIIKQVNIIFNEEFKNYDELMDSYKDKKVLLFIDNLETLIRDVPEAFDDFNYNLPREWRLLVTSRISVSSSSIIALKKLNKKSAIQLAKIYTRKHGQKLMDEDSYNKIIESCHYNPLAIRLTLDLYISGKALPESINISSKMIAEFSFQNLITNLSENSIMILEALFLEDNLDRVKLSDLLAMSLDDISESIYELSKTSLIIRESNENLEFFKLSSSIRDLLLVSPRNIKIRNEIQTKLVSAKILEEELIRKQQQNGVDEFDLRYIPEGMNHNLILLIQKLNKESNGYKVSSDVATDLYSSFIEVKETFFNNYMYQRSLARIHTGLGNYDEAISSYKKAIEINENDYLSMSLLANTYFHNKKEYEKAEKYYYEIIKRIKLGVNLKFAQSVLNSFFLSLLYQHKYEVVFNNTKNWKDANHNILIGILGTYRASAWRRKIESIPHSNVEAYLECMSNAIETYDDLFSTLGYIKIACRQVIKLFDEIERNVVRDDYPEKNKLDWLDFIGRHINSIENNFSDVEVNYVRRLIQKLSKVKIDKNIFTDDKWLELAIYKFKDTISEDFADKNGYTIVNVTNIPNNPNHNYTSFIFASDGISDYFIHFSSFVSECWNEWKCIYKGLRLAVKYEILEGESIKATEMHIVE